METSPAISRREAARSILAAAAFSMATIPANAAPAARRPVIPGPRHSDRIPDATFVNQRKRPVQFYSDLVKDQAVLISFLYTRCEGSCPVTLGLMKKLRDDLAVDFGRRLTLISVTLDPEHDTADVISEYAALHAPGRLMRRRPDWQFLTGNLDSTTALRRALGVFDPDPRIDSDRTQHAALLTFGNDVTNRWSAVPALADYDSILPVVRRAIAFTDRQRQSASSIPHRT